MIRTFLDLRDCPVDRTELRRFEKLLRKNFRFEKKHGRVLFFTVPSPMELERFFSILEMTFTKSGYKHARVFEYEKDLFL